MITKYSFVFYILFITSVSCSAQNPKLGLAELYKEEIQRSLQLGIQHASTIYLDNNGKARGDYEISTNKWSEYEPAWHTGQLIKGLLDAYKITKDDAALKSAIKAGNWWVSLQFPRGHRLEGFLNAIHGDKLGNLINTTTITDGTPGLFELSRISGNTKYAEVATTAGKWILDSLYIKEKRLSFNIVNPVTGEIWKDKSPHAIHHNEPYNLKQVARPNAEGYLFKDMYESTGIENYKIVFLEVCDGLVASQSSNGFWMDFEPNDFKTGKIHARFNTWNAEALLEAYEVTHNKKYLEAAVKTGQGLTKIQDQSGIIYYNSFVSGSFDKTSPCGSAISFAGILWLRLYKLGYKEFAENVSKAFEFTIKNQFPSNHLDKNLAGGYFEMLQDIKNGKLNIIYRDIATAFGLRFLSEVYQFEFQ